MRTARRVVPTAKAGRWSPAVLPSVVAWWHSEDLAGLGVGASIPSWTDRIKGAAAAQATPGNQPTVSAGTAGKVAAHFTRANSQNLSCAVPAGWPTAAPFTVWVVGKLASSTATLFYRAVQVSGTGSNGWAAGAKYRTTSAAWLLFTNIGLVDYAGTVYSTGLTGTPDWLSYQRVSTTLTFKKNNLPLTTADTATTGTAGGTVTTVTLGGVTNAFWDGDIYDVVVVAGTVSAADFTNMAHWMFRAYGTIAGNALNSPTSVGTPSADATGTCVESSVVYDAAGINGHTHWLGFVPYGSNSPANENPSIDWSDDGTTWSQTGVTNPVVAYPGGGNAGNNSDPHLYDNRARDGLFYLFWQRENTTPVSVGGVYYKTSTDCVTWSAATHLVTYTANWQNIEAHLVFDPVSAVYRLYSYDASGGATRATPRVRSAATIAGLASAVDTILTLPIPGSRFVWHMGSPFVYDGKIVLPFSDDDGYASSTHHGGNLWLASSPLGDGVTFRVADHPIFVPSGNRWDAYSMYRLVCIPAGDGANMWCWYNGQPNTAGGNWRFSDRITVPLAEIP